MLLWYVQRLWVIQELLGHFMLKKKKKISPRIASGKLFEVKSLQVHLIMELLLNSTYSEWIMLHQISVSNHLPTGFVDILGKVGEMYFVFISQTLAAASTDNCSVISWRLEAGQLAGTLRVITENKDCMSLLGVKRASEKLQTHHVTQF